MNKLVALIAIILISVVTHAQTPFKGSDYIYYYQVGVGKTNGSLTTPSAWLEIGKDSTNKGVRIPRVVDTANITSPLYGLMVYQIKDNGVYFRDKVSWKRMIDPGILNFYLLKADSTIYYPYWSNPRNYISSESDPIANARTVRWINGTGITVSNSAAQSLSTNPVATISAQNTTALWNANQIQGSPVSSTPPTNGQFLQYSGGQYTPTSLPPSGTVTSVGLSLPSIFSVTGSPVTTTGTLSASLNNQLANLVFASPNGLSGQPTFRSIVYTDLPASGIVAGNYGNDTSFTTFTVNNRGILTSGATIPLTLDRVVRGGNYTERKINLGDTLSMLDTTGLISWRLYTDYAAIKFYSSGDITQSSNLVFDMGDNGGQNQLEGFLFRLDSGTVGVASKFDTALQISGIYIKSSKPVIAPAPTYSSGGISALGRNATSGRFETFTISAPTKLSTVFTDASNSSSGTFSALYNYTIPANTLTANGQYISADYAGNFAANGNTKGVQVFVNGTGSGSSDQAAFSGEQWTVRTVFLRTGTTTGRVLCDYGKRGSSYIEVVGLNYTSTITFNLWGLGGAAGDVTAKMGIITFNP